MACVTSYPPKTVKQLKKVLSSISIIDPRVALLCELMCLTGLRFSDVSKLTVKDVMINNVFRDSVKIIQTKVYSKMITNGTKPKDAKAQAAVIVYLNEQAHIVIKDLIEYLSIIKKPNAKLLFESEIKPGQPFTNQYVNKILKKVAIELKLSYQLSTHSFRKMFARLLIKNNADMRQIQDKLGHKSLSSTTNYLMTFSDESKKLSEVIKF